jgi:hypothetical protein
MITVWGDSRVSPCISSMTIGETQDMAITNATLPADNR